MKKSLLALSVSLLSLNIFACGFEDMGLYQVQYESNYTVVSENNVKFPGYLFSKFPSLEDFDYENCQDAVKEVVVMDTTKKRFNLIFTSEDSCDGGNSYGLILDNKTLAPIATINDSDISCL